MAGGFFTSWAALEAPWPGPKSNRPSGHDQFQLFPSVPGLMGHSRGLLVRRQTELENGWHTAGSLQDVGFVVCNQIPCFISFVTGNGGEYFFFFKKWLVPLGVFIQWNSAGYSWQGASLVTQTIKRPPAMHQTRVQSLGGEDPLEKGKATHSSNLAWRASHG